MDEIAVKIETGFLLSRVKMHLEVIGKRAVNVHGEKFYAKLTTSSVEDVVLRDFIDSGVERLVSELSEVVISCRDGDNSLYFLFNRRWLSGSGEMSGDMTEALSHSVKRYLVVYAVGEFLSSIFPSGNEDGIPMYGETYLRSSDVILGNIRSLAFLKRPVFGTASYLEMLGAGERGEDGTLLSMLRVTRNGQEIGTFNGVVSKTIDISVPEKVSELKNDRCYLTSIDGNMVAGALGYTPLDSSRFTRGGIQAELKIQDWALGSYKPEYESSEIRGLDDVLSLKYDKADYSKDFRKSISEYQLGHTIVSSGEGNYISSYSVSDDGKELTFHFSDMETLVKGLIPMVSSDVKWGEESDYGVVLTVGEKSKVLQKTGGANELFEKVVLRSNVEHEKTDEGLFIYQDEEGVEYYATHDDDGNILTLVDAEGNDVAPIPEGLTAKKREDTKYAIRAKYDLFSVGGITAYGIGDDIPCGGNGAGAVLTENGTGISDEEFVWNGKMTADVSVGNVVKGTEFKVGTTLEEIIRRVFYAKPTYPIATVRLSTANLEVEYGEKDKTITVDISRNQSGAIRTFKFYRNGEEVEATKVTETRYTYTERDYITEAVSYKAVVDFDKAEHREAETVTSGTLTITPYWKWYGGQFETPSTEIDASSVKENILLSAFYKKVEDHKMTTSGARLVYVAIPDGREKPNLTDPYNIDYFESSETDLNKEVEITMSGANGQGGKRYKVYYYLFATPANIEFKLKILY